MLKTKKILQSKSTKSILGLGLIAISFLAINVASNNFFPSTRIDLTENNNYTLSEGTINIVKNLKTNIRLKFFYSEAMATRYPQLRIYADRVKNMITEIVNQSNGHIHLEFIDPEPFSETEDTAVSQGITSVPVGNGENIYFGLLGENELDGSAIIPFFSEDREKFLEYDIVKLVEGLSNPHKTKIAVLTSLPMATGPDGIRMALSGRGVPYSIYSELINNYDVTDVSRKVSMLFEKKYDILLIAHPPEMEDKALYAIDQYIMRGGRVVIMVDPKNESRKVMPDPAANEFPHTGSSDMPKFFKHWNVDYTPNEVVLDKHFAQRVQAPNNGRVMDYVAWLNLKKEAFYKDDPIVGSLSQLSIGTAGVFKPKQNMQLNFTPLVYTSKDSGLVKTSIIPSTPDPQKLSSAFIAEKSYIIAGKLNGIFTSIFSQIPDGVEDIIGDYKHISKTETKNNIILIADTDFLDDRFWLQETNMLGQPMRLPFADNGNFLLNMIDNLNGSNGLITLRGRTSDKRPFTYLEKMRQKAEQKFLMQEKILTAKIQDTQKKLETLKTANLDSTTIPSVNQQQNTEIQHFTSELIKTRQELREVQLNLNRDLSKTKQILKIINIVIVPSFIVIVMIAYYIYNRYRRIRKNQRILVS
jgi:ABC-type uncharacterized transport system involved in gliding motility auxiliary subunit